MTLESLVSGRVVLDVGAASTRGTKYRTVGGKLDVIFLACPSPASNHYRCAGVATVLCCTLAAFLPLGAPELLPAGTSRLHNPSIPPPGRSSSSGRQILVFCFLLWSKPVTGAYDSPNQYRLRMMLCNLRCWCAVAVHDKRTLPVPLSPLHSSPVATCAGLLPCWGQSRGWGRGWELRLERQS